MSSVTHITFSATRVTTARHVQITAVPVMTRWDIIPVMRMETRNAWKDGGETTALTPSALPTAARGTVTASHLVSVSVVWGGRGPPAASACITRAACMGPAHSRGSVCVRKVGAASSVTRI